QLERGEIDLNGLIWQARSRLMFANDADDADRIAHELATLTYDPKRLKEELQSLRQRIAGHHREWVHNLSNASSTMRGEDVSESSASGASDSRAQRLGDPSPTESTGRTRNETKGRSKKSSTSESATEGRSETLVPIHEDFYEISSRTYFSFDEQRVDWAKRIRSKRAGEAFGKFKDDPRLYDIAIEQHRIPEGPAIERAVEELVAENFESEFFRSAASVKQEEEILRERILGEPPVILDASGALPEAPASVDAPLQPSDRRQQQAAENDPFT
ncbi:MAG: hypothetical protein KY475_17025, partial [Planctomycetes bacterium]|nr:hypothetical protein [Planctomycetota bacterium]